MSSINNNLDKPIYIYQIVCNEPNINENYIGQTECFERRKKEHCHNSKHSDLKLYKTIRENGGWDNWNMRILSHYYYSNHHDARQIEQKYIDVFKTTLNSIRAYSKSFINEELDRRLEFELRDFSNKILGCFLYDYLNDNIDIDIDNEDMECKFCKNQLSTISNLNYHIKNNKNCLEIQKNQNQNDNNNLVSCDFCKKSFSNKSLKIHLKSCKNKSIELIEEKDAIIKEKDAIIEEMKNRILKLETENDIYKNDHDFVKNLAAQPKTTNNNKIRVMNNFFDNPEKVKQLVNDKLTQNHICDGQKGVAQFAYEILLRDEDGNINYFCTDPSRYIFKFQNAEGEMEKDIKAVKLTNMLLDAGIKHKAGTIAPTLWTKKDGTVDSDKFQIFSPSTNEIILMQMDNSVFRNELACLTSV